MRTRHFGLGSLLHRLPPELAHQLAIIGLRRGRLPTPRPVDDPILRINVAGLEFANPVGLAAGFDKNGEVPDRMLALGLGFVEVGSVTPRPQRGNPKPRIFRLTEDRAVINRLGFNSRGAESVAANLERFGGNGIIGINLGANKDSASRITDYVTGYERLAKYASYITINVSSPNTPGLRALQEGDQLRELLSQVLGAQIRTGRSVPIMLKIAPDLSMEGLHEIVQLAMESELSGLIIGNTTTARPPSLRGRHRGEPGGLSGAPIFERSTEVLRQAYNLSHGAIPLIGVGGISSGADAYAKIRAGASLVQLYTGLIYQGPALIGKINRELARLLRWDGFAQLKDAVGADARPNLTVRRLPG